MRVLVLAPAPYDTSPAQRFRIEQWARYLERDGFQFTFVPFADNRLQRLLYSPGRYASKAGLLAAAMARRLAALRLAGRFDVVFVPREVALVGPAIFERLIRRLGCPIVYDFDDPIWMNYRSPTNGFLNRLRFPGKTATICRLAARVIVGNRLLADWAEQHTSSCEVIPSTIDMEVYPSKPYCDERSPITLGWTGSHSTLVLLDMLADVLNTLSSRYCFRLLVISHTDRPRIDWLPKSVELVGRRWRSDSEATDLHDIDIGLAPFVNSGWTPWRCHGKVLQYMAVGVPCVASRVGILPEYIDDGQNGFLASETSQWVEKLSALMESAALRRRLGEAGRTTIEQRYAAAVWAPRVGHVLEDAVLTRGASLSE